MGWRGNWVKPASYATESIRDSGKKGNEMLKKIMASAILAGTIAVGAAFGTGTASATGSINVCYAIDEAPTYTAYLIDAAVWGKAFDWDSSQQAYNIVSAVATYCPWHLPGIKSAAAALS
jgi:hypothetical protein